MLLWNLSTRYTDANGSSETVDSKIDSSAGLRIDIVRRELQKTFLCVYGGKQPHVETKHESMHQISG